MLNFSRWPPKLQLRLLEGSQMRLIVKIRPKGTPYGKFWHGTPKYHGWVILWCNKEKLAWKGPHVDPNSNSQSQAVSSDDLFQAQDQVNNANSAIIFLNNHCSVRLSFVVCGYLLFIVCRCLSFVIVCRLSLFVVYRCLLFIVVCSLPLFVIYLYLS